MNNLYKTFKEMKIFLILWLTQSFSALGSSMTAYALIIWSYNQKGSALATASLMVCSYAPYVIFSVFAGALSDSWNKKFTMLVCDSITALTTIIVLVLLISNRLEIWHIYVINAVGGVMNTVQSPASEVAVTKILPEKYYQKVGGLRYMSNSANTILTPIITTAVIGFFGLEAVICIDLITFAAAFLTLLLFIKIPEDNKRSEERDNFIRSVKSGVIWLKNQQGVFTLILFLAAINLVASMYNAAFPAMLLSRNGGSEITMGIINTVIGITTLIGSIFASIAKPPKNRVRVICNCLLFSMSTENLLLALGNNALHMEYRRFLGWITIPLMSANMEAILRLKIPENIQGRIYSVRNSLQFFTIPLGYFLGGFVVEFICEPIMAKQNENVLTYMFGTGKGSGAALFFFIIAFIGIGVCLYFRNKKSLRLLDKED